MWEKVSLKKALNYIKKLTYKEDIHFSNLGCDLKTYDKVIEISEKKKFSISHANEVEINNFYLALQKFGASIVSLAELKNRSDFVLIIGELEKSIFKSFIDFLDWKKKKFQIKFFIYQLIKIKFLRIKYSKMIYLTILIVLIIQQKFVMIKSTNLSLKQSILL